jgi:aryl-alcohol dehydrogenase-like predicted oxidoreductase
MNKINRREFLVRSAGAVAGLTVAGTFASRAMNLLSGSAPAEMVGTVTLGRSGLVVPRLAFGTGSFTRADGSNQVRLGQEAFSRLLRHGYERGIRLIDTAESYRSIPLVGEAIKGLPRENLTILAKMWTQPDGSGREDNVRAKIEEYLGLFGTDRIDILLMHCMMEGNWDTTRTHYMEGFTRAKEEGLVRAVGVSCHNIDALRLAASHPWIDVILARINPWGTAMDGKPEEIREILHTARDNGKGVIGMKIFGEGRHITEPEREESIRHGFHDARLHAMTIGTENFEQADDAADRVIRLSANL